MLARAASAEATKSHRFADQVAEERAGAASARLDVLSTQVVASILNHSDPEQAATLLDVLNDSGDMTISTGCMVASQMLANVLRRIDPGEVTCFLAGITRLALQILEDHRQLALLQAAEPAGAA